MRFLRAIVFGAVAILLVGRNILLRAVPFQDWDSGIYAEVAREILRNKSLITTFNGHIWLNKPPLVHTLVAGVFAIFGESEFWARMLMVVLAMILLLLLYALTKKVAHILFSKEIKKLPAWVVEGVYLIPVVGVATSPLFIDRTTILNTDIILGIAWLGYFYWHESFAARLLFLCLGVWSKSFTGYYPLILDVLLFVPKRDLTLKNAAKYFLLLLVASSWHIFAYLKFGDFFIQAHVKDQVLKRVVEPIELHFGAKLYYADLLWDNIRLIPLFLTFSIFVLYERVKGNWKKVLYDTQLRYAYAIILSPVPFFALLMIMKSKIPWYLVTVLPLFYIPSGFIIFMMDRRIQQKLIFAFVGLFALVAMLPATIFLQRPDQLPEKITIANCIASTQQDKKRLYMMVDLPERQVRNLLESSQLTTETSFLYGGSPSFVFYLKKPVYFSYDPSETLQALPRESLVMLSRGDLVREPKIASIVKQSFVENRCSADSWVVLTHK